jgi:hypothetical protein
MSRSLTRRRFLVIAVTTTAAGASLWRLLQDNRPTGIVAELFDDFGAARAVGREYLQQRPEEAGKETLLELLSLRDDLDPMVVRERMRAEVRRDYDHARVVLVSGWYLSRTEARLCALAASS